MNGDARPESECECKHGHVFRSPAKWIRPCGLQSSKPCPVCGTHELMRLRTARASVVITSKPERIGG